MYKTYSELYRKNEYAKKMRNNDSHNYLSSLQPCNKNMPVGSICCNNYLNCSCSNNSTNTTKCLSCDYQRSDQPCASNNDYYSAMSFPNPLSYNNMNVNKYQIIPKNYVLLSEQ